MPVDVDLSNWNKENAWPRPIPTSTNAIEHSVFASRPPPSVSMTGAEGTPNTKVTWSSLAHIDEMFTNNRDPDEIFQTLRKMYKENDANSKNTEVLWRMAKACLLRAVNLSNERGADKDERRVILDQGLNWANKALKQNSRDFESLKYKCMLLGHRKSIKAEKAADLHLHVSFEKVHLSKRSIDNMFFLAKSYQKTNQIAPVKKCFAKSMLNESRQMLVDARQTE